MLWRGKSSDPNQIRNFFTLKRFQVQIYRKWLNLFGEKNWEFAQGGHLDEKTSTRMVARHHQDDIAWFRRRSQPKPSFATVTGKGSIPEYKCCFFHFNNLKFFSNKYIEIEEQIHPLSTNISWLYHQPCIAHTNLYTHSMSISMIYITNHLELPIWAGNTCSSSTYSHDQ